MFTTPVILSLVLVSLVSAGSSFAISFSFWRSRYAKSRKSGQPLDKTRGFFTLWFGTYIGMVTAMILHHLNLLVHGPLEMSWACALFFGVAFAVLGWVSAKLVHEDALQPDEESEQ